MLLFRYLGRSVLYGLSILLLTIPTNIFLLRILNRMTKYENKAKDARTKRTTETILTMKLLKLQVSLLVFGLILLKLNRSKPYTFLPSMLGMGKTL